jgi:cytochrome P450
VLTTSRAFDEGQTILAVGFLSWLLAPAAHRGRAACQAAFTEYYDKGYDSDAGGLVNGRNEVARKYGITNKDLGRFEVIILWVAIANTTPTIFWMLCHILSYPDLTEELRQQILTLVETSVSETGITEMKIDVSKMASHTPLLVSAYQESLRITNHNVSMRKVMADTTLTSPSGEVYFFQKGTTIQMPAGVLHKSPEIWNSLESSACTFDARRFIRRDTLERERRKAQTQGFMPFGGGKHICPGRWFGLTEILGLTALLLVGFEIEKDDGGRIGVPEARGARYGVTSTKPIKDPGIRIRRRKEYEGVAWGFKVQSSVAWDKFL